MTTPNKEPSRETDQTPELVKKFYHALIDNGTRATSEDCPDLFDTLNSLNGGLNLPEYPLTIGKYAWGNLPQQENTPMSYAYIEGLALGEVVDLNDMGSKPGSLSTPVGMIRIATLEKASEDAHEASFFTVFKDGTITIEGTAGIQSTVHNHVVENVSAARVQQHDFGTIPFTLNVAQSDLLVSQLASAIIPRD